MIFVPFICFLNVLSRWIGILFCTYICSNSNSWNSQLCILKVIYLGDWRSIHILLRSIFSSLISAVGGLDLSLSKKIGIRAIAWVPFYDLTTCNHCIFYRWHSKPCPRLTLWFYSPSYNDERLLMLINNTLHFLSFFVLNIDKDKGPSYRSGERIDYQYWSFWDVLEDEQGQGGESNLHDIILQLILYSDSLLYCKQY